MEIEMMLKLNKNMFITYPEKVVKLPNEKWKDYIPIRPFSLIGSRTSKIIIHCSFLEV
jgi:hypothetical protein